MMRSLIAVLLFALAAAAGGFRMVPRAPPAKPAARPDWQARFDVEAKRDRPVFLYFTAHW